MAETEFKGLSEKSDHSLPDEPGRDVSQDPTQRKLMLGSLALLLVALSIVIWHEREFWFPEDADADSDQAAETVPAKKIATQATPSATKTATAAKPARRGR